MLAKTSAFTVALFIAGAAAQSGMSKCAQDCISQAVKSSTCSGATDVACFCTNAQFQSAFAGCLSSNCPDEVSSVQGAQAQQCSDIGVNVSAGGAAPTGTAPGTNPTQQPPAQDPSSGAGAGAGQSQSPPASGAGQGQPPAASGNPQPSGTTPGTGAGTGASGATGGQNGSSGASSPPAGGASQQSVRPSITGPVTSPSGAASQLSSSFVGVSMVWAVTATVLGSAVGAGLVL